MPRLSLWRHTESREEHPPESPSLAEKIIEAVDGGLYLYDELRAWAESEGYAPRSFYQTISDLQTEGLIESRCGGLFPADGDDIGDWDLV